MGVVALSNHSVLLSVNFFVFLNGTTDKDAGHVSAELKYEFFPSAARGSSHAARLARKNMAGGDEALPRLL